jgi:hypothetical protein
MAKRSASFRSQQASAPRSERPPFHTTGSPSFDARCGLRHVRSVSQLDSPLRLRELCRDEQHLCCAYGNVALALTLTEPDPAYLQRASLAITQYGSQSPHALGLLTWIEAKAPPPRAETRAAIQQLFSDIAPVTRACIIIIEGEGFRASAKRSAVTLINMAARLPYPLKVTASVSDAAQLLLQMLGTAHDARMNVESLATAATTMRAQFVSASLRQAL